MQNFLLFAYVIRGYSQGIFKGAVDCFFCENFLLYSNYTKTWNKFSRLAI